MSAWSPMSTMPPDCANTTDASTTDPSDTSSQPAAQRASASHPHANDTRRPAASSLHHIHNSPSTWAKDRRR